MRQFSLLGYKVLLLESENDVEYCIRNLPENIGISAFDTETNTPIDMTRKDSNLIDILHDKPFLIQIGHDDVVYLCDIQVYPFIKTKCLELLDQISAKSSLMGAHNVKFDIHMIMNLAYEFKHSEKLFDTMALIRMGTESKTEREGGIPLALKPACSRLLGSVYADADHKLSENLNMKWAAKLKNLAISLKPYKVTRRMITDVLKDVTSDLSGFPIEVQEIYVRWEKSSKMTYMDIDRELLYEYAATDVILVLELTKLLLPVIKDRSQLDVFKREMKLIMPLVRMERTGYSADKNYILESKFKLIREIMNIRNENYSISGEHLTPNQHMAIRHMLKSKFGYVLETTDKNAIKLKILGDTSMPNEVKMYLSNVMHLRTLEKWITAYINPMLFRLNKYGSSKVYTTYNPNGAVSGRFTSNFQQFPKVAIKSKYKDEELFHPRKMFIVNSEFPINAYIDYSQIELRLQAEYTYHCTSGKGDINMLRAYMPYDCLQQGDNIYLRETKEKWNPVDLHTQSAQTAFPEIELGTPEFKRVRDIGKRVNFALIYGASLKTVQETLADTDPSIVAKLYYGFYTRFKDVLTYAKWVQSQWARNGYVTNLLGRRYYISDSYNVYKLNNYLIQGSAADIIKVAIIAIDNMLRAGKYKTRLQGCIHDEICICTTEDEFNEVIPRIQRIMENSCKTFVPIVAEIEQTKTTWAHKAEAVV